MLNSTGLSCCIGHEKQVIIYHHYWLKEIHTCILDLKGKKSLQSVEMSALEEEVSFQIKCKFRGSTLPGE